MHQKRKKNKIILLIDIRKSTTHACTDMSVNFLILKNIYFNDFLKYFCYYIALFFGALEVKSPRGVSNNKPASV